MHVSKSALFYFLATIVVAAGEASTNTIKKEVEDGVNNKISFSFLQTNSDGYKHVSCILCEFSVLCDTFDANAYLLCVSCTHDDS